MAAFLSFDAVPEVCKPLVEGILMEVELILLLQLLLHRLLLLGGLKEFSLKMSRMKLLVLMLTMLLLMLVGIWCKIILLLLLLVGLRLLLAPLGSNVVTRTACCTVGIAFPVYSTFKAIEKKDRSEQEKWLLYWAAYGSFSLVEVFSDKILSWFPLYYHMKFAFLVWLQFPSGNGARHLYARHLRPFLLRHQDRLDQLHGFVTREITKFIITHQGEIEFLKAILKKTANQMLKEVNQPVQPGGQNTIEGPNDSTRPHIQGSGSDSEN